MDPTVLLHAHPVLTVAVFTWLVLVVFAWALVDGAAPMPEPIQRGGDWQWPEREES